MLRFSKRKTTCILNIGICTSRGKGFARTFWEMATGVAWIREGEGYGVQF
jgi:hypothetical protein